jgi:hypothetical protein
MKGPAPGRLAKRADTRAHYDKYPFRFDQRVILDEKMERRLMGAAIQEIRDPDARILDVGTYQDPNHPPTGVHHVFVNGERVVRDGAHTGARPGRALRRA